MESGPGESRSGPGSAGGLSTVELTVEGMHCASCATLIEETLGKDGAVHAATVDLDAARASVTYDDATVSIEDLCATVAGIGYSARPVVHPAHLVP